MSSSSSSLRICMPTNVSDIYSCWSTPLKRLRRGEPFTVHDWYNRIQRFGVMIYPSLPMSRRLCERHFAPSCIYNDTVYPMWNDRNTVKLRVRLASYVNMHKFSYALPLNMFEEGMYLEWEKSMYGIAGLYPLDRAHRSRWFTVNRKGICGSGRCVCMRR